MRIRNNSVSNLRAPALLSTYLQGENGGIHGKFLRNILAESRVRWSDRMVPAPRKNGDKIKRRGDKQRVLVPGWRCWICLHCRRKKLNLASIYLSRFLMKQHPCPGFPDSQPMWISHTEDDYSYFPCQWPSIPR